MHLNSKHKLKKVHYLIKTLQISFKIKTQLSKPQTTADSFHQNNVHSYGMLMSYRASSIHR